MIKLNLLPIKEELKYKRLLRSFVFFNVILLLILIAHFFYYNRNAEVVSDQRKIVSKLDSDVTKYKRLLGDIEKEKKKREEALRRIDAINSLDDLRHTLLKTLNEVNESIPNKTWISNLKKSGNKLVIKGGADSYDSVTKFARSLKGKTDIFVSLDMKDVHTEIFRDTKKIKQEVKFLAYEFNCVIK